MILIIILNFKFNKIEKECYDFYKSKNYMYYLFKESFNSYEIVKYSNNKVKKIFSENYVKTIKFLKKKSQFLCEYQNIFIQDNKIFLLYYSKNRINVGYIKNNKYWLFNTPKKLLDLGINESIKGLNFIDNNLVLISIDKNNIILRKYNLKSKNLTIKRYNIKETIKQTFKNEKYHFQ